MSRKDFIQMIMILISPICFGGMLVSIPIARYVNSEYTSSIVLIAFISYSIIWYSINDKLINKKGS